MAIQIDRALTSVHVTQDEEQQMEVSPFSSERSLRPERFEDYPGQTFAKENLKIYVQAALSRKKPLDHVILHGPPGLGKTTLAHILAHELEVPFCSTSAPSIEKAGDLAGILAGLESSTLLFIDEIHRLSIQVEELLYSAMEDFALDVLVGQGPTTRSVRVPIRPFTLVGATTKLSLLSRPFLNRFGIQERLDYYDEEALLEILMRSAEVLGLTLSIRGGQELAKRSRGTPRIANRLLRRVWDFSQISEKGSIDQELVEYALGRLDIDYLGLDRTDREILRILTERYAGGPVGIETLAATVGEDRSTLEEVYEPFLVYKGLLSRGPRGRSLTSLGKEHVMNFSKMTIR
ncbi:MAG: Holliday junction branch migration DNA helicase RuvB [Oligoflexales bacterium]|nr:Holliday junction branch migration DNA helicase RuvB [Oligoflexales bacterium]